MIRAAPVSYETDEHLRALPERSLGEIVSESFAIYRRNFRRFLALVAVVQVPVALLTLVPSSGATVFVIVGLVSVVAGVVGYGAAIYGVGHQYATGRMDVGVCYSRVSWRLLSLGVVAVAVAAIILLLEYVGSMAVTSQSAAASAALLAIAIPLLILIVYAVFTPQAVILEGLTPRDAVARSFRLVRSSWLRVFGVLVVLGLVSGGLAIGVTIPFAAAAALSGVGETSLAARGIATVSGLVVSLAVLPVIYSGITLLYFDMRVRKEGYDVSALSREVGAPQAESRAPLPGMRGG